ncbi:MAG: glutamyl-tRNA reductase, partial [Planctomycetota bacterium]
MNISVTGINHREASVGERERLSLSEEDARTFLHDTTHSGLLNEALVLDTCNRTEIYFVKGRKDAGPRRVMEHACRITGTELPSADMIYQYAGLDAVNHLFRVAAGLDSQVVGEDEILGQVKDAYSQAHSAGSTDVLLNKLLHRAFRVGKRVRTETLLSQGAGSVPGAAVELARQMFSRLEDRSALLIGAGETAETAARALLDAGVGYLAVANRTLERAEELADRLAADVDRSAEWRTTPCGMRTPRERGMCPALTGLFQKSDSGERSSKEKPSTPTFRTMELDDVPESISGFDVAISSTGAQGHILPRNGSLDSLSSLPAPLLMVDIAVPRDIDPQVGELSNVFLYNIDDLDALVEKNQQRRRKEISRAEAIVEEEAERFRRWMDVRRVVPTIKELRARMEELQQAEIEKYGDNFEPSDREDLEKFARSLCRKILHEPITYLRQAAEDSTDGEHVAAAEAVRDIFDLED